MTPEEIIRILRLSDKTRNISDVSRRIEVGPNGEVGIRMLHGQLLTPPELIRHISATGLTKREEFLGDPTTLGGRKPLLSRMPRNGPMRYGELQYLARKRGLDIVRESYHVDQRNLEAFQRTLDSGGISIPTDKVTTVIRVFKSGVEQSREEAMKLLGWHTNVVDTKALSKLAKRMTAVVSERGMVMSGPGRLKVAYWTMDELRNEMAGLIKTLPKNATPADIDEVIKASKDGIMEMNPVTARKMARTARAEARTIRNEVRNSFSEEAVRARRDADRMVEWAEELERTIKNGGIFNMRALGLERMDGEFIPGGFKGNVYINAKRGWKHGKADIVTLEGSATEEFGFVDDTRRSFLYVDPRPDAPVRTDIQSFVSHRNYYDMPHLLKHNAEEAGRFLSQLRDTGQLQPGFIRELRNTLAREMPDNVSEMDWKRSQAFAKKILGYVDSGLDLRTRPDFMQTVIGGYLDMMQRTDKKGNPLLNLLVPDSSRGFILDEHTFFGKLQMEAGQAMYDPHSGAWVLEQGLFKKFKEAAGGWDLDDAIANSLVYDETHKTVKAIGVRSPTAANEILAFNILEDDATTISHFFRLRGLDNVADMYRRDTKQIRELRKKKTIISDIWETEVAEIELRRRELLQKHFRNINNIDEFLDMSFATDPRGDRIFEILRDRLSVRNEVLQGSLDDSVGNLQKSIVETGGMLGRAINIHELQYFVNNQFKGALDEAKVGTLFKRLVTEELIDSIIMPHVSLDVLEPAIAEVEKQIGIGLVRAKHVHGISNIGLDPYLWKKLLLDENNLRVGMREEAERLGLQIDDFGAFVRGFRLAEDDPNAIWTKAIKQAQAQIEDVKRIGDELVKETRFIPEIMDVKYTEDEIKAGQAIIDAWDSFDDAEKVLTRYPTGWDDQIEAFGQPIFYDEEIRNIQRHAAVSRAIAGTIDNSEVAGMKTARAIGAAMRMVSERNQGYGMFSGSIGSQTVADITNWAIQMMRTGGDPTVVDRLLGTPGFLNPDTLEVNTNNVRSILDQRFTRDKLLDHGIVPGAKRAEASSIAAAVSDGVAGSGSYTRVFSEKGKQFISDLWAMPSVRKGAALLGGLAIFSEVYRRAKDPSPEDMQGPPMLPGGSFYEDLFMPERPDINYGYVAPSSGGVTYRISARGSGDPMAFRSEVERMTGVNPSGTIYNTLSPIKDTFGLVLGGFS